MKHHQHRTITIAKETTEVDIIILYFLQDAWCNAEKDAHIRTQVHTYIYT